MADLSSRNCQLQNDLMKQLVVRHDSIKHENDILELIRRQLDNPRYTDLKVFVGPDKQEFKLHRMLLRGRSEYFDALLQESDEDRPLRITLNSLDPLAFQAVVGWIYRGKFEIDFTAEDNGRGALISILEVGYLLKLEGLEEAILRELVAAMKVDINRRKHQQEWILEPLEFMDSLCLLWPIEAHWDLVVDYAHLALRQGCIYTEDTLSNVANGMSEFWLRCYIAASQREWSSRPAFEYP